MARPLHGDPRRPDGQPPDSPMKLAGALRPWGDSRFSPEPKDMGVHLRGVGAMKSKRLSTIHELLLDGKLVDRAMRRAVQEALLRHKRAGVPAVGWRSGKVVLVRPTQIKASANGSRRPRWPPRTRNFSHASG